MKIIINLDIDKKKKKCVARRLTLVDGREDESFSSSNETAEGSKKGVEANAN